MTKKITQILSATLVLFPFVASAQNARAFNQIIDTLIVTFNSFIIPVLFVMATLIFLWGVVTYIAKADDDTARKKAKMLMLWGIIGLAVMTAVWTIVQLLVSYFGVGGAGIPHTPGFTLPGI